MKKIEDNNETVIANKTKLGTGHIIAILAIIILILALVIINGFISKQKEDAYKQGLADAGVSEQTIDISEEITVTSATLKEVVSSVRKLNTFDYVYSKVGLYEKSSKLFNTKISLPFTTDKTIYTYSGKISMGIDLKDLTFDVDSNHGIITVHYPEPQILSHTIDQGFEFYDLKKAAFNRSDFSDFEGFRSGLKENVEKDVKTNEEIKQGVKDSTESVVESILTASGKIDDYVVVHEWSE